MSPEPAEPTAPEPAAELEVEAGPADGRWHRLHPLTPLLRGGIALIAVLGIMAANLRERLIEGVVGGGRPGEGDPIDWIVSEGLLAAAVLAGTGILALFIGGFWLSWRMHSFRITEEAVEVRRGILFRTSRKARLDRIQAINIARPVVARLLGTARLEISQAGNDANVELAYLSGANADGLRREILRLASGIRSRGAVVSVPDPGGVLDRRVRELLAPELDPRLAPPESVVRMHPGRLAGSIALSETALVFTAVVVGAAAFALTTHEYLPLLGLAPALAAMGGYLASRFTRSLRYSIAGTPDGVRVGFGLLSTSNETLPPGRIHSLQVSQSLLWRPFGWWQVRVNRASRSAARSAPGQENTTVLPVGDATDTARVLGLMLPGVDPAGLVGALVAPAPGDGFVNSPRRAAWLRWFSWRRNGFRLLPDAVLLRKGWLWRNLVIVPLPRVQGVSVHQGPLARAFGLARVWLHTVNGPITASLAAVDRDAALEFFEQVAVAAVAAADPGQRWHAREAG